MVLLCRYFTSLVGCVLAAVCYGQSSLFDSITVKQLLGDWKGRLTYLDYQSNKPYTMPADLIVTQLPNGYQLVFSNIYPNEPKANNHDTLTLREGGKMIDNEVVMSRCFAVNRRRKRFTQSLASGLTTRSPTSMV